MDIKQADKLAEKQLTNGVTDIVVGRMELAMRAHSACHMIQMFPFTQSMFESDSIGGYILAMTQVSPQDQACLYVGFDFECSEHQADIYHKDNLVILWKPDVEDPKHVCKMTVANFFRFLNTIPNIYQFADFDPRSERHSEEGLFFLSYFSQTN